MSVWEGLSPPYATIVADPPWPYDDRPFTWRQGKAETFLPYETMGLAEIAAMPVGDLAAPAAHLYVWTTNRYLFDARSIVEGWGFAVAQVLVWCKSPTGIPVGTFNSNTTEFVIFARLRRREIEGHVGDAIRAAREAAGLTRKDLVPVFIGHYKNAESVKAQIGNWERGINMPSDLDWDLLRSAVPGLDAVERPAPEPTQASRSDTAWWTWPRGPHSAKPAAFLDIVEQVSPGPYVELFARAPRLGWDSWGNGFEMPSKDAG